MPRRRHRYGAKDGPYVGGRLRRELFTCRYCGDGVVYDGSPASEALLKQHGEDVCKASPIAMTNEQSMTLFQLLATARPGKEIMPC